MAQADYIISNQTFPNTRADINNHLSAIATNNSGTSAPTTQYAGQFWIDTTTTTWTLYIHDGTDDIQFATIDTSANTVNFTDSALDVVTDTTPQLGGDLDLNSNDITGTGNINITGNITASGNLAGTLTTASQPNITSLGTLTGLTTTGDINLGDNDKANFGASNDLQIYHDGSDSYIVDAGTGVLALTTNGTGIQINGSGEAMGRFNLNGSVDLYYDNSKKFETTSAGATVTGTLTATAFSGDGSGLTGVGGGITEADIWRLTTNFTGSAVPISSNWERVDDATFSKIGTGMTESSGIFTFPSTGIWWIIFHLQHQFNNTSDIQAFATLQGTPDNGSTWDVLAYGLVGSDYINSRHTVVSSSFFDVQNTSNYKARMSVESVAGTNTTSGSSVENQTWVEFIRLGDT